MTKTELNNQLKKRTPGAYIKRAPAEIRDASEVVIYCPVHGDQRASASFVRAFGCPKCNGQKVLKVHNNNFFKKVREQERAMRNVPQRKPNGDIVENDMVKKKGEKK